MPRVAPLAFAVLVAALPLRSLPAAQADSAGTGDSLAAAPPPPAAAPSRPALRSVSEALLVNVLVNRMDAWVFRQDWAFPSTDTWSRNVRLGWEWDENNFLINLFLHPFHGALYFNTGRVHELTFWESAPLAFLGSWTWEYFGETHRPSLNDFFMTSFGGIALGEVFHRVAASIRGSPAHGTPWRELAALPLDPVGGLHRLLGGRRARAAPLPEDAGGPYVVRLHGGARFTAGESVGRSLVLPTLVVDLVSGDPFLRPYRAPFDVFAVRAIVSSGGGTLNALRVTGRLLGKDLNDTTARYRHAFVVNQRFDYIHNPAHQIGGQSVEAGIASRWRLRPRVALHAQAFGDVILLGAIDAPAAGVGERIYDFGAGSGARVELGLSRDGARFLTLHARTEYLHAVSGASAGHHIGFFGAELNVPVARGFGLGVHATDFRRNSRYPAGVREARDFQELRLLLTWTGRSRPARP